MKVAIVNKTERLIILSGIKLIPGANYIEDYLVNDKVHKPMLEGKVADGCIEMPSPEIDDDFAESTLGGYNAKDAIKLVKETNDYDELIQFRDEEVIDKNRKSVLDALNAQIKISEEALKGKK